MSLKEFFGILTRRRIGNAMHSKQLADKIKFTFLYERLCIWKRPNYPSYEIFTRFQSSRRGVWAASVHGRRLGAVKSDDYGNQRAHRICICVREFGLSRLRRVCKFACEPKKSTSLGVDYVRESGFDGRAERFGCKMKRIQTREIITSDFYPRSIGCLMD